MKKKMLFVLIIVITSTTGAFANKTVQDAPAKSSESGNTMNPSNIVRTYHSVSKEADVYKLDEIDRVAINDLLHSDSADLSFGKNADSDLATDKNRTEDSDLQANSGHAENRFNNIDNANNAALYQSAIPEPATVVFLLLGSLVFKRKTRKVVA